jgi:D-cysteine desulfhydrase family pyridoxal phosphate-dependent enzyme
VLEPSKLSLIQSPTPLHRLNHLSAELQADLWIKRDDMTGFAAGGNKGRKLEYLIAKAVDEGATAVVGCGSRQSNFVRQLAGACSVAGLKCSAAVMALPFEYEEPTHVGLTEENGNDLLNHIFGADIRVYPNARWEDLFDRAEELALELEARGERVLRIPVGGSSPLGAFAFYKAGLELQAQDESTFDWILFASSSGSTHVGLQFAFHRSTTKVVGIACDPEPEILGDFQQLYAGLEALVGEARPSPNADWRLNLDYVGEGYGIPSHGGQAAIRLLARTEGILLDPVYSGKAFAGLLDLLDKREIGGRILFWHTGGSPALFALRPDQI